MRLIWRELLGLFVDDRPFALSILLWLAAMALLEHVNALNPLLDGIMFFAGFAALLVENIRRSVKGD